MRVLKAAAEKQKRKLIDVYKNQDSIDKDEELNEIFSQLFTDCQQDSPNIQKDKLNQLSKKHTELATKTLPPVQI